MSVSIGGKLRSAGHLPDFSPMVCDRDIYPFLCRIGISVWPYIVPRILTMHDAAAPEKSHGFLPIGVIALLPLIPGYTAHSHRAFRGKVTDADGYH